MIPRFLALLCTVVAAIAAPVTIPGVPAPGNPVLPYRQVADAAVLMRVNATSQASTNAAPLLSWGPTLDAPFVGWDNVSSNRTSKLGTSPVPTSDYPLLSSTVDQPLNMGITRYELWVQKLLPAMNTSYWYFDRYVAVDTTGNVIGTLNVQSLDSQDQYRALVGTTYTVTASEEDTVSQVYTGTISVPNTLFVPPHYLELGITTGGVFAPVSWTTKSFTTNIVSALIGGAVPTVYDWQLRTGTNLVSAPETALKAQGNGSFYLGRTNQAIAVGNIVVDDKPLYAFPLGTASITAPTGTLTNIPSDLFVNGNVVNAYPQSVTVFVIESAPLGSSTWNPIFSANSINGNNSALIPITKSMVAGNGLRLIDVASDATQYRISMFIGIPYNLATAPPGSSLASPATVSALTLGTIPATAAALGWGSLTWLRFSSQGSFSIAPATITLGVQPGPPTGTNSPNNNPAATIITQ